MSVLRRKLNCLSPVRSILVSLPPGQLLPTLTGFPAVAESGLLRLVAVGCESVLGKNI